MYPENPEETQVIVGSMNMGYISDTAMNRTHNPFRPKWEPIPLSYSDSLLHLHCLPRFQNFSWSLYLCSIGKVDDLIPHVVKAARIVLTNPSNQVSVEHFELLKKQWTDNMEKLRGLVDEATDTADFIRANGKNRSSSFSYNMFREPAIGHSRPLESW